MLNKIVPIRPFDSLVHKIKVDQKSCYSPLCGPRGADTPSALFKVGKTTAGHSNHFKYSTPIKPHRRVKLNATNLSGFKKQLSNQITARGYLLYPSFNRRKHSHSHWSIIGNQLRKFGKTFGYLSVNKINFLIAWALKDSYGQRTRSAVETKRAIPNLVNLIETDSNVILVRNQTYFTFAQAKQSMNHSWYKPRIIQITQLAQRAQMVKTPSTAKKNNINLCKTQYFRSLKHLTVNQPSWVSTGGVLRNL